jgi:uncharacterized protein YcfJ
MAGPETAVTRGGGAVGVVSGVVIGGVVVGGTGDDVAVAGVVGGPSSSCAFARRAKPLITMDTTNARTDARLLDLFAI